MIEIKADIFKKRQGRNAIAITTNGVIRNNGRAVMGAGIALKAREFFPGIDTELGIRLKECGNHATLLQMYGQDSSKWNVITLPTKNDWKQPSDLQLIIQSCKEVKEIADSYDLDEIYMPRPGCSNGKLDWETQVRPAIKDILDDRFIICTLF